MQGKRVRDGRLLGAFPKQRAARIPKEEAWTMPAWWLPNGFDRTMLCHDHVRG